MFAAGEESGVDGSGDVGFVGPLHEHGRGPPTAKKANRQMVDSTHPVTRQAPTGAAVSTINRDCTTSAISLPPRWLPKWLAVEKDRADSMERSTCLDQVERPRSPNGIRTRVSTLRG